MVPEESRSQGSQNGICAWRHDEESVTEHQGSQNEPLGAKMSSQCMLRLTLPFKSNAGTWRGHSLRQPVLLIAWGKAAIVSVIQNRRHFERVQLSHDVNSSCD
jgi:hypothetical protein